MNKKAINISTPLTFSLLIFSVFLWLAPITAHADIYTFCSDGQSITDCNAVLEAKIDNCPVSGRNKTKSPKCAEPIKEALGQLQQMRGAGMSAVGPVSSNPPQTYQEVKFNEPDRSGINIAWRDPLDSSITTGGIPGMISALLDILITLMIPVITLMIIYSGFMYVTARGNAEQVKKATTSLTYAIIGAILVIGALILSDIIKDAITSIT